MKEKAVTVAFRDINEEIARERAVDPEAYKYLYTVKKSHVYTEESKRLNKELGIE